MRAIGRGSTGRVVKRIQRKVGVEADGVFGPATERAVKRWQKAHGLLADGVVGPLTYKAMFPIRSLFRRPADIIVLDIGHGWNNVADGRYDSGAADDGFKENPLAAKAVQLLKHELEARGRVVRIVRDAHVSMRGDLAARFKPYLFIPNHLNAGGGTGVEVLVAKRAGRWIVRLAARVSAAIAGSMGVKNRGVKRDVRGLAVFAGRLKQRTILIEWIFIDDPDDRKAFAAKLPKAARAVAAVLDRA